MTPAEAYTELGLAPGAEKEAAAAAYRALCMKHHPDRGGDPARMRKVTEAWAVIRDAPADAGPKARRATSGPRQAPQPPAPRCHECGLPMYVAGGTSVLDPTVAILCPECRAGWGTWRLVSFAGPWLLLALIVARFMPLPLNEAAYIVYALAAVPVGVRLWRPLTASRPGSGLRGLASRRRWLWALRAPLTVLLGVLGTPVLVLDAAIVTGQAIRAGGGRDSAYLKRHAEAVVMRLEDGVRGWMRPVSSR